MNASQYRSHMTPSMSSLKVKVIGQIHGHPMKVDLYLFYGYGCVLRGDVHIPNRQRAASNMLRTVTQSKTPN